MPCRNKVRFLVITNRPVPDYGKACFVVRERLGRIYFSGNPQVKWKEIHRESAAGKRLFTLYPANLCYDYGSIAAFRKGEYHQTLDSRHQ